MKLSKNATASSATSLNAVAVSAAATSFCATTNVCFQWGVPESSAKAGSGNVYFQLKAPTSEQWVGLGIGSSMPDSSMFIMYQDGKGNVTLSTRPGADHVMPTYEARSDVTLLSGSGVVDGSMVANVKCSRCTDIDLTGSTGWIAAWKSGPALDEPSPSAVLTMHDDTSQFNVDMSAANISSDSNPFVGTSSSPNSNGTPGAVTVTKSSDSSTKTLICAHGITMSVVFACLFPIGSVLMLLIGKWYLHAAWQMIAFLGMWAGFGLGVTAAKRLDIFFDQAHTRMGTIIVALLAIQPIFGLLHHNYYAKNHSRGIISYVHIWYGRALLITGIVNGGLGLQLAYQSKGFIIAYSVVAGVIALVYFASVATMAINSRSKRPQHIEPP